MASPTPLGSPAVTVVMATFNRGRHILPSVRSVLRQTIQDIELLVVGDHCTDNTEEHLRSLQAPNLRWINLPERCGGQAFPNNRGIEEAKAPVVAYIGHDDIWAPDHLETLLSVLQQGEQISFAVAGAIYHLPPGVDRPLNVTGLFGPGEVAPARRHFFPPSSIAHRREVQAVIGGWRDPFTLRMPVDVEFQMRAAAAGLLFASTGKATVHKFAAGHRYLSYLRHDSAEQEEMLRRMEGPRYSDYVAFEVERSQASGLYMTILNPESHAQFAPGQLARENAQRKGNLRPALRTLQGPVLIKQEPGECALDWEAMPQDGIRWAGINPYPKLLISHVQGGPATALITFAHEDPGGLATISFSGRDSVLSHPIRKRPSLWLTIAEVRLDLPADDYTILDLDLNAHQISRDGKRGLGIGNIVLVPEQCSAAHLAAMLLENELAGAQDQTLAHGREMQQQEAQFRAATSLAEQDFALKLAMVQAASDDLRRELERSKIEAAAAHVHLQAALDAVHASNSWHLTEPLRRAVTLYRKWRGRASRRR